MSVIVELTIPSEAFELGQILRVKGQTQVTLETMVPLSGRPTPFVRVTDGARASFERAVREHGSVTNIRPVDTHDEETLYALEWEPPDESLFRQFPKMGAALLGAAGGADRWQIELRFPTHEALSTFQEYYVEHDIPVSIEKIYNPTKPDAGPWYGLTPVQRETLTRAVESGYYALPRQTSTKDLAAEFDVSDQATTERLRRGISTLVENTLLAVEHE